MADSRLASATRDAVLAVLLRQGEATASDLAGRLSVSVQVMRRHLRSLEEDGLVQASVSHEGPGRPSNLWCLTAAGHDRFPDGSETFALGLLQAMRDSIPQDQVARLMLQQALVKADDYRRRIGSGSLAQRLERLVELRRAEGYVAECRRDETPREPAPGSGDAEAWLIHEFHCSVMRIAEEFPMVCDQELQLIRHTFPDCSVERVHWRLESGHSCGFRISAGGPAAGADAAAGGSTPAPASGSGGSPARS
ncbi:MAG: iron-sulfur cluster biosynthesis transcriptional regulator SufR [Synechococcaceae cyanobacterium]|nr:iron-sulfur cluster biosynthesis transcriptional regulator SufR [Synechococcaceae cyanobacterium]